MVSSFLKLLISHLKVNKSLKLQECPPHIWKSETLDNHTTKDTITYLYCEHCQQLAGSDGKRETFSNIE